MAALAMAYWGAVYSRTPSLVSDFDQLWVAARMLRAGVDPYTAIREGTPVPGGGALSFAFFYPLPAVVAVLPLSWLPVAAARALFCGVTFGALAYALMARGWWGLLPLLSAGSFLTLSLAQWGAVVALAVVWPVAGALASVKPNALLAVAAGWRWRDRRGALIAAALALLLWSASFVVLPYWLPEWLAVLRGQDHFRPLVWRAGGVLMLGAVLRWRDPRARWLVVTALVPATPVVYSALPLLVYPDWSRRQLLTLSLLSHLAMWVPLLYSRSPGGTFTDVARVSAVALIWLLYLPAMGMVGWRVSR